MTCFLFFRIRRTREAASPDGEPVHTTDPTYFKLLKVEIKSAESTVCRGLYGGLCVRIWHLPNPPPASHTSHLINDLQGLLQRFVDIQSLFCRL